MKCLRAEELFSDYVEATLAIPLRLDLEDHLESCRECASLLESFREVINVMGTLPAAQPSAELVERILTSTRPKLPARRQQAIPFPGLPLPNRANWAVWAAAAAFVAFMFIRPPAFVSSLGQRANRLGRQAYSFGVRVYQGSDRLIDELNVLRMTVGVAFEDRLDRINERLKDLDEARRKTDESQGSSNHLAPRLELTQKNNEPNRADIRSLL